MNTSTSTSTTRTLRAALAAGVAATIVAGTVALGGAAAHADEPVTTKDGASAVGTIAAAGGTQSIDRGADQTSGIANGDQDDERALAERQRRLIEAMARIAWAAAQANLQDQPTGQTDLPKQQQMSGLATGSRP